MGGSGSESKTLLKLRHVWVFTSQRKQRDLSISQCTDLRQICPALMISAQCLITSFTYNVTWYVMSSIIFSTFVNFSWVILVHRWLQWRHNGRDSLSNHQPHYCLLNLSFKRRSRETSKLRVTDLWERNSPVTGEFPAQRTSKTENISSWWRHHV